MSDNLYIHTHEEADHLWQHTRRRKLSNNTYLVRSIGWYGVKLHSTIIIKYYPNGDIVLDSGGWQTYTTKDRMNSYQSRVNIYQDKGLWYVCDRSRRWDDSDHIPFSDGMVLHASGDIATDRHDPSHLAALRKKVMKFTTDYIDALSKGKVPAPSAGDCLYCQLVNAETGKAMENGDHILHHIKEKYYVPSLLMRAIEEYPVSRVAGWYVGSRWSEDAIDVSWGEDISKDQLRKSLRKFIFHRLGLPT